MNKFLLATGVVSLLWANAVWAAYQDEVLVDNPVAYYRFEETSGVTANDSSPNANDGSYMNGVLLSQPGAPALGRSARFDGIDDYVSTARTVATNFTLELWIFTRASSPTGSASYEGDGLLWSDVGGGANDFTMAILNDRLSFFAGDTETTVTSANVINDARWHHLVVTRAMGGITQIFVDGVSRGTMPSGNSPLDANPQIAIGANVLDGRFFDGLIDEVAYYPTVLSVERIRAHFLAGSVSNVIAVPTLGGSALAGLIALLAVCGVAMVRRQRS